MLTQQDTTNTEPEQIEVEIMPIQFSYSDIMWRQEGYELIGVSSNGSRFGLKIDPNLRLCGVDADNKPLFKRIDK
jgi:hypothetical protein